LFEDLTLAIKSASKLSGGFTIPEAIIAMLIMAIAVLGTMSMRYQSVLDSKRADVGISASRLVLMITETWRCLAGSETFDPISTFGSELTIEQGEGPDVPDGFTLLGNYKITFNGVEYYTTLSYQDINTAIRQLNVQAAWEQRGTEQATLDMSDKNFAITAYAEK
jgi:hypothetical protein